jgi:hypothetical protein
LGFYASWVGRYVEYHYCKCEDGKVGWI